MKAKSLHFSKHGTVQPIAAEIGRVFQCVCDQIPPAYPCEGEKVVFIGVDMSGKVPAPVDHFCRDLNESRTKNVAFYLINGQPSALEDLKAAMAGNGVHMVDDVLQLDHVDDSGNRFCRDVACHERVQHSKKLADPGIEGKGQADFDYYGPH